MKGNRIERIIVDVALLGRRNGNFLVIACTRFLENCLQMVFLLNMSKSEPWRGGSGGVKVYQSIDASRGANVYHVMWHVISHIWQEDKELTFSSACSTPVAI